MAIHINNVCSEKQAVKGEALSAPQCREGSQEKKSKGRWCPPPPHCFHHCSGISQLHCDGKALPQVGERLGFPGDLFEIATHSQE